MKILLIWPKGFEIGHVVPIALGYLKSNTPVERHEVQILDCTIDNIGANSSKLQNTIQTFKPDLVGVSFWTHVYPEAMRIFKTVKKINPKILTVAGGVHCTAYPDAVLNHNPEVDFLFRGDSEESFVRFIDEIEQHNFSLEKCQWSNIQGLAYRSANQSIIKNQMDQKEDLDQIQVPDYNAMRLQEYIKAGYRFHTSRKMNAPIWVTRGCPYRCTFCAAPLKDGRRIRKHSIPYLTKWVQMLYHEQGIRNISIIDDNFTFDTQFAKEFCHAMIALNLKGLHFTTPNGIRIQRTDRELLTLMKQAGWEWVCMAPESGSLKTLKRMKKDTGIEIFYEKVKEVRSVGLKANAYFIIGFPGETREDLKLTSQMIRKCNFDFFYLNNFQPLPGTPIYTELVEAGELPEGTLPGNYVSGERVYVPKDLKDFNFSAFILKEYLYHSIRRPFNVIYMFRANSLSLTLKKLFSNIRYMIFKTRFSLKENRANA